LGNDEGNNLGIQFGANRHDDLHWLIGPFWSGLSLVAIGVLANRNPFAGPSVLMALAQPVIYSVVWTLYLLMSRRVANTYDEEEPEVEAEAGLANVFE
jgi:hypothetical protein